MLPDPLHPALVHFPIVLALLAPLLAAGFLWAIGSGRLPARAWLAVVVLQAVIVGATWVTMETGEEEEERVERVIREDPIEEHEEAAEWFLWIAGLTLPVAGAGLLSGGLGTAARGLALAGTLVAALAVARVGHTGGELVYRHGAAIAYLDAPTLTKTMGRKAIRKLLAGAATESAGMPSASAGADPTAAATAASTEGTAAPSDGSAGATDAGPAATPSAQPTTTGASDGSDGSSQNRRGRDH